MKKHHFLVAFVTGDDGEGTNVVEFWAKNWSLRRLKVLTKQAAR